MMADKTDVACSFTTKPRASVYPTLPYSENQHLFSEKWEYKVVEATRDKKLFCENISWRSCRFVGRQIIEDTFAQLSREVQVRPKELLIELIKLWCASAVLMFAEKKQTNFLYLRWCFTIRRFYFSIEDHAIKACWN